MTNLLDSSQRTEENRTSQQTYERIDDYEVLDAFVKDITDGTIPIGKLEDCRFQLGREMVDLRSQLKMPGVAKQEISNRIRNRECTLIIIDVCTEASQILQQKKDAEWKGRRTEAIDLNARYKAKIQEIYDNKIHAIVKKVTSVYAFAGVEYHHILQSSKRRFFEQ